VPCALRGHPLQARPMPSFDQPMPVVPSAKPLTKAKTPNFATAKKLRRRTEELN